MDKHGELLISWEKSLLVIKTKGPFNEEGALAGIIKIKESVVTKNVKNWQRLGVWDEASLASPDALKMVKNAHQWCLQHGCERVASVVVTSLQQSVAEKMFDNEVKIFRLESDARKWLASK